MFNAIRKPLKSTCENVVIWVGGYQRGCRITEEDIK